MHRLFRNGLNGPVSGAIRFVRLRFLRRFLGRQPLKGIELVHLIREILTRDFANAQTAWVRPPLHQLQSLVPQLY